MPHTHARRRSCCDNVAGMQRHQARALALAEADEGRLCLLRREWVFAVLRALVAAAPKRKRPPARSRALQDWLRRPMARRCLRRLVPMQRPLEHPADHQVLAGWALPPPPLLSPPPPQTRPRPPSQMRLPWALPWALPQSCRSLMRTRRPPHPSASRPALRSRWPQAQHCQELPRHLMPLRRRPSHTAVRSASSRARGRGAHTRPRSRSPPRRALRPRLSNFERRYELCHRCLEVRFAITGHP